MEECSFLDTICSVRKETSNNYFDGDGPRQLERDKKSPVEIYKNSR